MRFSLALVLAASLGLLACGGSKEEAKSTADVSADWSTFSGKYSESTGPREAKATKSEKGDVVKKESAPKAKEAPAPTEEAPIAAAPAAPKSSKGSIKGESLSSISESALSEAAISGTKSKLVSSSTLTGAKYETITVETKKATIRITRVAGSPNATGPEVASPKQKAGSASATTASWLDEDADVLVTVTAPKKAAATKTLNAIVKH